MPSVMLSLAACAAAADTPLHLVSEWGRAGKVKIACPVDLALDSKGRLLVLDQARNPVIHVFELDGIFVTSLPLERCELPGGLAVDAADNIYVTDLSRDTVIEYSPAGKLLTLWGGSGETEGRLRNPRDVVIDKHGDIWVTDEGNRRIVKFAADSHAVLQTITFQGNSYANAIAMLPDGRLAGLMTAHVGRPVYLWNPDGSVAGVCLFWGFMPKTMGLAATPDGKLLGSCFESALVEIDPAVLVARERNHPPVLYGDPVKLPHQVFAAVAMNGKTGDIYLADKYGGKILRLTRLPREEKSR